MTELELRDWAEYLITIAEAKFKVKLPQIEYRFNIRARSLAGEFQHNHDGTTGFVLRFHKGLMHVYKEQYRSTVAHEVAHAVAVIIDKHERAHGATWQAVMEFFCFPANRQCSYDFAKIPDSFLVKRAAVVLYRCDCRTHEFSQRCHKSYLQGRRYKCSACKHTIYPIN